MGVKQIGDICLFVYRYGGNYGYKGSNKKLWAFVWSMAFDGIIDVYNQECLIKLKHQSYTNEKRTAYLKCDNCVWSKW